MLVGVVNLLNEGNLAGAEQEVRQLIADANPNVPIDALILLAEIHRQKGEFVQAVEVIHHILNQHAAYLDNAQLCRILAFSYKSLGKYEEAEKIYRRLAAIVPEDLSSLASVIECKIAGNLTLSLTEFDSLSAQLKDYIHELGLDHNYKKIRAYLLARSGRIGEALEEYLPAFRESISPHKEKGEWYGLNHVLSSDSILGQSQRFGSNLVAVDKEFAYIRKTLRLAKADSVVDVGGAGGLFAERLSKYVEKVTLTDRSPELVAAAQNNLKSSMNINFMVSDITSQGLGLTFDKILMSGVTPAFKSQPALQAAIHNLVSALNPGGRCLVSNNYDISSAEMSVKHAFEKAAQEPLRWLYKTMFIAENLFWIDIPLLESMIRELDVGSFKILNMRLGQDKRRMFDLLITKY